MNNLLSGNLIETEKVSLKSENSNPDYYVLLAIDSTTDSQFCSIPWHIVHIKSFSFEDLSIYWRKAVNLSFFLYNSKSVDLKSMKMHLIHVFSLMKNRMKA